MKNTKELSKKFKKLKSPPGMRGWNFSKEKVEKARKEGKMLMMYLDFTSACDLRCIYCQTRSGKPLPGELTWEERKTVIDQAKELGCETIHIAGQGEPTLDPLFWRGIEYIHKKGIIPVVFTHGMHIDKKAAERLFNLNASVIIKIHSLNPKNQDWLSGVKGYARKRDEAIQNLFEVGFNKTYPTRIGEDTVIVRQNIKEIPNIFRWARKNNVFPEIKTLLSAHRGASKFVKEKMAVPAEEICSLHYTCLKIDQEEFGYTWTPRPPYIGWYCDFYYYHMYVNIQGDIMSCVGWVLQPPLGNIRTHSLREVWNSPIMQKVRNIDKYLTGTCGNCPIDCYGCPCRRLLRTGDIRYVFETKRNHWEDNL